MSRRVKIECFIGRFFCMIDSTLLDYKMFHQFFFLLIYFLLLFPPTHLFFSFLLYSMGTQLHIPVYIIFSPIVVLHCKYLDIVLSAAQQDLIVNPPLTPSSQSLPLPPTSLGNHKSILQVRDFLFCGKVHLCYILDSDISDIIWYLSFSF